MDSDKCAEIQIVRGIADPRAQFWKLSIIECGLMKNNLQKFQESKRERELFPSNSLSVGQKSVTSAKQSRCLWCWKWK